MSTATDQLRAARDQLLDAGGDIDRAVREFRWPAIQGPFNWAIDWFDAHARGNDTTALRIREEDGTDSSFTFDEMASRSDQVANYLAGLGIGKGDVVAVMLGNQVELWDVMLGVMKLGAVIVPTATALISTDLADRVQRAHVKAVICNPADTGKFDGLDGEFLRLCTGEAPGWLPLAEPYDSPAQPREVVTDASDPVIAYFTSGTTKQPKLVQHTQVSYPVGHLSTMFFIGVRPGDVHLNISSPGWAKHAWSSFFAPWLAGATVFVYNYTSFDAADLLTQLRQAGVASFCAPPTVWRMMILADLGDRPAQLREIVGAGEPLNPEVISQVQRQWGLTIRDGYGQTETTAQIGNVPGMPVKPGSMGKPLPGVPIVIVNPETGQPGDEGEICLDLNPYPLNLMAGYLGDPYLDAEVKHGGYYHTGDLVSRDADGYLTYVGRDDDVFKASDYKVSPFEVESVLMEHPAVAEVAVIPAHDPTRLAVPKAVVVLAPGWDASAATALAILAHGKDHLSPHLRVRRLEFRALPKTISNKIRRAALRDQEPGLDADPDRTEYRYSDFPELRKKRVKPGQ